MEYTDIYRQRQEVRSRLRRIARKASVIEFQKLKDEEVQLTSKLKELSKDFKMVVKDPRKVN